MSVMIFNSIVLIVGFISVGLTIRALVKGPIYLSATNFGWSKQTIQLVFDGNFFGRLTFHITPLAVLTTGILATISTLFLLFWPLDYFGRADVDLEWTSYRIIFSITLGVGLGFGFVSRLFLICRCAELPAEITSETHPPSQLEFMLVAPKSITCCFKNKLVPEDSC